MEKLFDYLKINIASPSRIRKWGTNILPNGNSVGEVTSPETFDHRTLKPEMGGLFCERIFGPVNDWECHCGKYINPESTTVCDVCGVEITESAVRRYRMGFIELSAPVAHI
jgi:DNA-directed RNA polymerase subunit beta'